MTEAARYDSDGHQVLCYRCGRPASPDNRCNFCWGLLCFIHEHRFPLTDIPLLDDDYEIMCEPCVGRECGVYVDLAALEDLTVLPCGHSVIRLHIPDQGHPYCRICCPHEEEETGDYQW